jgi:DNA polymerase III subunit epsilon
METLNLAFTKPLVFVKIQTTGLNPAQDRIIELSFTRIETDGKQKTGTRLVNPTIPIPAESIKLHGITDEKVKDKPTFKEIADGMSKFLDGCDFIGFNIGNFDLKFLTEEFNRAGVEFTLLGRKIVDLAHVYHSMEPRDLTAAYSYYCGKTLEKQIGSQKTTEVYVEIINKMMEKYKGKEYSDKDGKAHKIEATVDSIHSTFNKNKKSLDLAGKIVLNDAGRPIFTFGKYSGKVVSDCLLGDKEYYEWLVDASDFPADTKLVVKKIVAKAQSLAPTK